MRDVYTAKVIEIRVSAPRIHEFQLWYWYSIQCLRGVKKAKAQIQTNIKSRPEAGTAFKISGLLDCLNIGFLKAINP